MRTFSRFKIIAILVFIFVILRIFQFSNLTELSLPHDAHHYLLLGKNLTEGKGYFSQSIWAISLRADTIPFPDFYRSPGLPLLYLLAFKIGGVNFWSAKILTVVLAAGILLFSFLLGLKILKSEKLALLTSLLLFLNPVFYGWSGQFLAELPYGLFSLITLYLLFSKNKNWFLIGIFWGLTYLCRYQALFLLGLPILIFLIMEYGLSKGLKYFILNTLFFILTISPWLWRNWQLTGDPFFSDLKYHLAAVYQNNFSQYFFGLHRPPEPINVFLTQPIYVAGYFFWSIYQLSIQIPTELFANLVLFFLSLFGSVSLWMRERKKTVVILLYLVLNLFFFSFSLPETRYLYPLLPIVLILASEGINFFWEKATNKKEGLKTFFVFLYVVLFSAVFYYFNFLLLKGYRLDSKRGLLLELVLLMLIVLARRHQKAISFLSQRTLAAFLALLFLGQFLFFLPKSFVFPPQPTALEASQSAQLVRKLDLPSNVVFMTGGLPYYFEYYLHQPVIQFPYYQNRAQFDEIVKQYQVKYFILTKTQKEFYPWLASLIPIDFVKIKEEGDISIHVQR